VAARTAVEVPVAAQPEGSAPTNVGKGRNADERYVCPVMGTVSTKVDPEPSVEYGGNVCCFCCAGHPWKFRAHPAKYIAQIEAGSATRALQAGK
jgi:YHS domain-containing protein